TGMTLIHSPVRLLLFLVVILDLNLYGVLSNTVEAEKYLELGKKAVQEGHVAEALAHYDKAVGIDPTNYLTHFKRAAVYLALGQSRKALPDLDKSIELRPKFYQARLQRGTTLLKLGRLDDAQSDFTYLTSVSDSSLSAEAQKNLALIPSVKGHIQTANVYIDKQDYEAAILVLGEAIELCPWDVSLRELRSNCYKSLGQYQSAISDLKVITKLTNDNTAAFLEISLLYYKMGEVEDSLKEVRECLKLDQAHKSCSAHYKKAKKLEKQLKDADQAITNSEYGAAVDVLFKALETESELEVFQTKISKKVCRSYSKSKNYTAGMVWCNKVLQSDPNDVDALCDRAELYIGNEMYNDAINDYRKAQSVENHPQSVEEGLQRAEKLLKQSQKKDYYKILGVKRTASKQEISKAYRELAKQWHPDAYEGEDKEKAERMFIDIAAAKEVLSDPEMRQKFDNGDDPLDQSQNQGPGGFHQAPFGFPFGGAGQGFTFKFRFQ
ncbi:hypothetical protein EMCRGX_G001224, partial [Ephydatia muelleri]